VIPSPKIFPAYAHIENIGQVSGHWLERIGHFFEHYKDLEESKWVKLEGWAGAEEARKVIREGVERFDQTNA